jgi:Phage integrase SAM-like domain/Arm DNA-binding domain
MTILFWLYKSRAGITGEVPIMMRITIDGKRVSFSTDLSIDPKSWDQPKQRIKGASPLVREMNNTLANLNNAARGVYNQYTKKSMPVDPESIRNTILRKNKSAATLLEAFAYQLDNLRARVGHDISANTIKKYETMERKMRAFLFAQNRTDIYLHELNFRFISELDLHMTSKGGLKPNAVAKNMQQLKRLIKVCINLEWLEKDPFASYSCKLSETDRGYLTAEELTVIEQVNLPNRRLEQVRDVLYCIRNHSAF